MTGDQLAFGDGREHARRRDPDTSAKAAAGRDPHAVITRGSQKHRLLDVYRNGREVNADTACVAAGLIGPGSPWKRVSDLHAAGYLESTGREASTRAGRTGEVLRITDDGLRALRAFRVDPRLKRYRGDGTGEIL